MSENNISKSKSRREQIPVYPAADPFPMISDSEIGEVAEDIQKSGLEKFMGKPSAGPKKLIPEEADKAKADAAAAAEATKRAEVTTAVASLAALIKSARKQEEIAAAFHGAEDVARADLGRALRLIRNWLPSFLYGNAPPPAEIQEWLSLRKEAGELIDPETAEVMWRHAPTLDPYGVDSDLPEELSDIGRQYFARAPGSDISLSTKGATWLPGLGSFSLAVWSACSAQR